MNNEAVAVYGTHNSPRIVAQRGVFTMFGQNMSPMERVFEDHAFPDNALMKVVVPADSLSELRSSTFAIGITESVVFPDLDGVAREIKRQFGYGA